MNAFWTAGLAFVLAVLMTDDTHAQVTERVRIDQAFKVFDTDGNGQLSPKEVDRPLLMRRYDTDKNGSIDRDEFVGLMRVIERFRGRNRSDSPRQWKAESLVSEIPASAPIDEASVLAAAQYSASKKGVSFLVMLDGKLVYHDYPNGGAVDRAHELASGTKSFTGVMAAAAVDDGLIRLDERVCDTIDSWKSDPQKSRITIEQLLHLTSGINAGSQTGRQVPSYASAIENATESTPGTRFRYGPAHFQCFGELMRRKLESAGRDPSPLVYLKERIFDPIGLDYDRWRHDEDGNPHLPSGAHLTATNWAKFGELVRLEGTVDGKQVISPENLSKCFVGSDPNPAYGLTFWMNQPVAPEKRIRIPQLRRGTDDMTGIPKIPSDLVYAAGAGKQRLYVMPSLKMVVVRQADGIIEAMSGSDAGFKDSEFLGKLLK